MNSTKLFGLFLFSVCLVLTSCNSRKENLLFQEGRSINSSELISDYELIPLEIQEDNLILDATTIKIVDDKIYILDCFSPQKSLYVFNMKGKYLGKVGKVGQGPGEYIIPYGFLIDNKKNIILIKDVAQNNLITYDLNTFDFIEQFKLPFYSSCFEQLNDESLVWYVESGQRNTPQYRDHIQITDYSGKQINSYDQRQDSLKAGMYNVMSYFHTNNNTTYVHHPFQNQVYECGTDSLKPRFTLSFENMEFPTSQFLTSKTDNFIKDLEKSYYIQYYELVENSQKILCYFGEEKEIYIGVYDKKKQTGKYYNRKDIVDDLGIGHFPRPKCTYKDKFVTAIITEYDDFPSNSIVYKAIKKDDSIKDGNPIILIYK